MQRGIFMKKNKILTSILAVIVLCASFFGGFAVSSCVRKTDEVNWTIDMILKHYYAVDPITGEKIELTKISSML